MNQLSRILRGWTLRAISTACLLLGATQVSAALDLDFQINSTPIFVGDTFTVDLYATDIFSGAGHTLIDEVTSFGYDWDFSLSGLVTPVGAPVLTPDLADPYIDAAIIADVVGFAGLDPIVNAAGQVDALITRFEFTALQAGSTLFSIDGSVPDANFERGFYYLDLPDPVGFSGDVMINVHHAVPDATSFLLLDALLVPLAVVAYRRRSRAHLAVSR